MSINRMHPHTVHQEPVCAVCAPHSLLLLFLKELLVSFSLFLDHLLQQGNLLQTFCPLKVVNLHMKWYQHAHAHTHTHTHAHTHAHTCACTHARTHARTHTHTHTHTAHITTTPSFYVRDNAHVGWSISLWVVIKVVSTMLVAQTNETSIICSFQKH